MVNGGFNHPRVFPVDQPVRRHQLLNLGAIEQIVRGQFGVAVGGQFQAHLVGTAQKREMPAGIAQDDVVQARTCGGAGLQ